MRVSRGNNLTVNTVFRTRKYDIEPEYVEWYAVKVLSYLDVRDAQVDVCCVTNDYIRKLNKRYMDRYAFTDVLAFPIDETLYNAGGERRLLLGEIIISLDQTKRNARKYNVSFIQELRLYVIHGILHLLGYDDTSPRAREEMFRTQDEIFFKVTDKDRYEKRSQ